MNKHWWIAGGLIVFAILLGIVAQPGPFRPPHDRAALDVQLARYYEVADADGQGAVLPGDLKAQHDGIEAEQLNGRENLREHVVRMYDTDNDGALSSDELAGKAPHYKIPKRPYGDDEVRNQAWHMIVAGDGPGIGNSPAWFEQADTNHDGIISRAEAAAGPIAMFEAVDANHDGIVTVEERVVLLKAMDAQVRAGTLR